MIGLTERRAEYERRGYTGEGMARGYRSFRRPGHAVRHHAARAAARHLADVPRDRRRAPDGSRARVVRVPGAAVRAVHLHARPRGRPRASRPRWPACPGSTSRAVLATAEAPETEAAFAADRAEARTAESTPTQFQGKSATTPDGLVRYTAAEPRVHRRRRPAPRGGRLPVTEAYDVCVANLDPSLAPRARRRTPPTCSPPSPTASRRPRSPPSWPRRTPPPDLDAAEDALIALAAAGLARRVAVGNDALWASAERAADRLLRVA